jgi:regulator of protease activity HflC (stomatin/prohibitin superfamily)
LADSVLLLAQQWVQLFLGSAQLSAQLLVVASGQQQAAYLVAEAEAEAGAAEAEADIHKQCQIHMLNPQLNWLRKIIL